MKKIQILISLIIITSLVIYIGGCPPKPDTVNSNTPKKPDAFPPVLSGTWKADNSNWILTFDTEGKLVSMTHHGNMVFEDLSLGYLEEDWIDGVKAVYILGPQPIAQYYAESRELSVRVVIEHFHIDFPNDTIEGSFDDTITGAISPDNKTWNAVWRIGGSLVGATGNDPNTPLDIKSETFRKTELDSDK